MFTIYFAIPILIWFAVAAYLNYQCKTKDIKIMGNKTYAPGMIISTVFFIFWIFTFLIENFTSNYSVRKNFMELRALQEQQTIWQNKSDNLTKQFQEVLVKAYPTYEKEIFNKMTPHDIQLLMIKYPEIKNVMASMDYVNRIDSLNSTIYRCQIQQTNTIRDIRYEYVNPFIITVWLPDVSKDIEKRVNVY